MALEALPMMSISEGLDASPGTVARPASRRAILAGLAGSTRKEACRWLASAGFEVLLAEDEAGALDLSGQVRADVVLVDMSLDHSGGSNLCRTLRHQAHGQQPVMALCWTRRDASAALEAGATELLERPFDWRVACLRAERLVRLAEAEADLTRAQEETEGLRKTLEDERRDRTCHDQCDALTGLPNGERLEKALENALVSATDGSQVAVALFEIEHLVLLNSRLGRARANSVLQQVAQRLDRRPALGRDAARVRGPVDVHGRPRRRRPVRGHAHRPAGAARGRARRASPGGPSLGPIRRR